MFQQQLLFQKGAIEIEFRFSVFAKNIREPQRIARDSTEQPSLDHLAHARRAFTKSLRIFIGQQIKLPAVFFHF